MPKDCTGPDEILILSFKQSYLRIGYLIRVCVWWLTFSLLVVTIPPALAGLYHAVREGLRDPFELTVKPRQAFLGGVGLHLKRSYILTLLNLGALAIIVLGVLFWFTREEQTLRLVTVIALAFLLFWWLCQPFLFALLVEYPTLSAWQVYRRTMRLVILSPFYALAIALANTIITLFALILLGPSLLYAPTLLALISIQALWGMTCTEIPDFIDPVVYSERQAQEKRKHEKRQ
jgi:uncharacterized membrane protein YesL